MNDMKSIRFPPPVADDMIRAILEGRKTVTRRVMKPQPREIYRGGTLFDYDGDLIALVESQNGILEQLVAPYRLGDILYVRETWAPLYPNETSNEIVAYLYKADRDCFGEEYHKKYDSQYPNGKDYQWEMRWRPSANMPREAARLFLRVTGVRVERLQDITEEQAIAEGVQKIREHEYRGAKQNYYSPVAAFHNLWDERIIARYNLYAYGWYINPWVWVIEFERCEKPKEDTPC